MKIEISEEDAKRIMEMAVVSYNEGQTIARDFIMPLMLATQSVGVY